MPSGDIFFEEYNRYLDEEEEAFDHEISQRKLALAYANANGLPPPKFPLSRFLPGETEVEERKLQEQEWERKFLNLAKRVHCPHCGYGLTIS